MLIQYSMCRNDFECGDSRSHRPRFVDKVTAISDWQWNTMVMSYVGNHSVLREHAKSSESVEYA